MRFWPGETVRITVAFTDNTGTPVAASGVSVQWRRDGGPINSAPVQSGGGTGQFNADIQVTEPGEYAVRATCAAPTPAAVEASFTVVPSAFA